MTQPDDIISSDWPNMTVEQLSEQRNILSTRLDMLRAYGHRMGITMPANMAHLTSTMEAGLHEIDRFIETKTNQQTNT